jgi:hypothetical protein
MGFIKELWSSKLYLALYEDKDLRALFNRDLEALLTQGGNKIHLASFGTGTTISRTDNLTVGSGLPLQIKDVEKDETAIEIFEFSTEPILLRNVDVIQSNQNLLASAIEEIKQQFKEFIFGAAATHIITNVAAANKLPWLGSAFVGKDLSNMKVKLDDNKVLSNNRFAIMPSGVQEEMSDDTKLAGWIAAQQQNLKEGTFPRLHGFDIENSTLIPLTTAAGAIDATPANNTRRNVLAWRRNYMHLLVQTDMKITGSERAEYLGDLYSFSVNFGMQLEKPTAAVQKTEPAAA